MIIKKPGAKQGQVLVTFELSSSMWAERANLVGNPQEVEELGESTAVAAILMKDEENGESTPSFPEEYVVYYH
jgi:hypothetical protein